MDIQMRDTKKLSKKIVFKAIIFDMEGVVIDSEPLWKRSQQEFLLSLNRVYNVNDQTKIVGKSLNESTLFFKEKYNLSLSINELINLRKEIVKKLFENDLSYILGFNHFFNKIKSKYKTCIATSCNDDLLGVVIEKLDLKKHFEQIFKVSDVKGVGKPNPAIFLYAANKMNVEPHECIVIEDSPLGIKAAKLANMFCIGVATTFSKEYLSEADLIVNNFDEINIEGLK